MPGLLGKGGMKWKGGHLIPIMPSMIQILLNEMRDVVESKGCCLNGKGLNYENLGYIISFSNV